MDLYETDFHAWALEQSALLRDQDRRGQADFARVAEEIEGLAHAARRDVERDLGVALIGLIRLAARPGPEERSALRGAALTAILDASDGLTPSMRTHIDLGALWVRARKRARREAKMNGQAWTDPGETCPFTLDHLLREEVEIDQLLALHILANVVPDVPPDEGDELR
jgi:hypothetical protein